MRIYTFDSNELMSQFMTDIIVSTMLQDKRVNLSLTGGSSPKRVYELLLERMKNLKNLNHVHYFTFDETPIRNQAHQVVGYDNYVPFERDFLIPAQIDPKNVTFMRDENYENFPQLIEEAGGLDLMMIGIGKDGHFCANMPECTVYDQEVYCVELSNEFPWNEPYQATLKGNYSDKMYTLGLPALIKTKRVVLIVNGKHKAQAVKRMIEGPLDKDFPASYLRLLPNFVILLDNEAASELATK